MSHAHRDDQRHQTTPPQPAPPPPADALPHPLTFFLDAGPRRAVLRRLRSIDADRAAALLRALEIDAPATSAPEEDDA